MAALRVVTKQTQEPSATSIPRFARDAAALLGSQGIITIAAIGSSIVTARGLGVEGRGLFGLAVLLPSLVLAFTNMGLGSAGSRLAATRQWRRPEIASSQILVAVGHIVVSLTIGFGLIFFLRDSLFPDVPKTLLVLGLASAPGLGLSMFVLPLLLGFHRVGTYSWVLVGSATLGALALFTAWLTVGLGVRLALVLQASTTLVVGLVGLLLVLRASGGMARARRDYLAAAYRFGIGIHMAYLFTFAGSRLIVLVLNAGAGPVAVGLYLLAMSIAERLYLLADAVGTALLPRVAANPTQAGDYLTPIVFRMILLVTGALAALIALIARPLVETLYSAEFLPAVSVLRILLLGIVAAGAWRVLAQDLNGRGHSGVVAAVNALGAAMTLAGAFLLAPLGGAQGAAWASILGSTASLVVGIVIVARLGAIPTATLLRPGAAERTLAKRLIRIPSIVALKPRFVWALARAYFLDGLLYRLVRITDPTYRLSIRFGDRLMRPFWMRWARRHQLLIAGREPSMPLVQLDSLGVSDDMLGPDLEAAQEGCVVLGEFDHYGWLIPSFAPIPGVPCTSEAQARHRSRSRVLLLATPGGVCIRKEYEGPDARGRFLTELRALERLRGTNARVPEVLTIDAGALTLTETFIPGPDLERILASLGGALTGREIRDRLGHDATDEAIEDEYFMECARVAAQLSPEMIRKIHDQVRSVHREGIELRDVKPGNIVVHQQTGDLYLIDFDSARTHGRPRSRFFLIRRDRDIERLNRALGTEFLTYRRIRHRLLSKSYPASDRIYAPAYIGHGLRIGNLWDPTVGFGRWHFILKRALKLPSGARVLSLGANNGSIELQVLRAGAAEVLAFDVDETYVEQGRFLTEASEWADNRQYRLEYSVADMREAKNLAGPYACVMALCSLYYLPEDEMRSVARHVVELAPRFLLQCNVRESIGRDDDDEYRRSSVEFAKSLLRNSGFMLVRCTKPWGYSRPLVEGIRAGHSGNRD